MKKYIVILSCENDVHATSVLKHIDIEKYTPIVLEREKYGLHWQISCFINSNDYNVIINFNDTEISHNEINSLYLRRDFTIESQDVIGEFTEQEKNYIATQRTIHVNSCIKLLSTITFTMNCPESNYKSLSKVYQLTVAQKVGLKIPQSFFGGNFKSSNFNDNGLCIKPLEGIHIKQGGHTYAHYTVKIETPNDEEIHSLKFCPAIIQYYIKKEFELRVTVVGKKVFACKIDSQKSIIGNIDWRHHDWANTPHYTYQLPENIEKRIVALMNSLNLSYGAIDMIFDVNDYYFLEVNSMGQWLWIEDFTELPISKSIAELLSIDNT